jgi:predicted RNase H-like nuclease (RuvC/YqgF family)
MLRPSPFIDCRNQKTPQPVNFKSTPEYMKKEIERLKAEIQEKDELITELQSQLEQPQKIYNERGAGRKTKITNEMIVEVLMLRQEGHGFSKIAKLYSENTGEKISKATVDKITKNWHFE